MVIIGLLLGSVFFGLTPSLKDAPSFFGVAFQQVGSRLPAQGGCRRGGSVALHCAHQPALFASRLSGHPAAGRSRQQPRLVQPPLVRVDREPLLTAACACLPAPPPQIMFVAFGSFPQMEMVLGQKAVMVKHRDARFMPSYAQVRQESGLLAAWAQAAAAMTTAHASVASLCWMLNPPGRLAVLRCRRWPWPSPSCPSPSWTRCSSASSPTSW
jgi:hypothetical protein